MCSSDLGRARPGARANVRAAVPQKYLECTLETDRAAGVEGNRAVMRWGPIFLALEPRLKTGILLLTGYPLNQVSADPHPPEIEPFHTTRRG